MLLPSPRVVGHPKADSQPSGQEVKFTVPAVLATAAVDTLAADLQAIEFRA